MVTLTAGIAAATLVIVVGVLAGPAIARCAADGGNVLVCLRGKVVAAGLLPAALPSSIEAVDTSSAAPVVAEVRPDHDDGWLQANAAELATPPVAMVSLAPLPGRLEVGGALSIPRGEVAGSVALAEPAGSLAASGGARTPLPPSSTSLTPMLALSHGGTAGGGQGAGDLAVLTASRGAATADGALRAAAPGTATAKLVPTPQATVTAPPPAPIAEPPRRAAPVVALPPKRAVKPKTAAPPKRVLRLDPRFPSVTVLPPPGSGADSSFATLD
jgi:hypothetical protein